VQARTESLERLSRRLVQHQAMHRERIEGAADGRAAATARVLGSLGRARKGQLRPGVEEARGAVGILRKRAFDVGRRAVPTMLIE
jgi:hypothetical protein